MGAIGIPIIVPAILFLVYDQFISPIRIPPINTASLMIMLGGILLGAFGEELGWRGYAQNLLERRLNGLVAFLLVGILWGLWHVGNFQHGPIYMLFFVFSTVGYSAAMAWLLQSTNYYVVLATLFHFAVNVGFYILQDAIADLRLVALNGLVWMGAAVVIVALNREEFLQFNKETRRGGIDKQHQSASEHGMQTTGGIAKGGSS
jgi:membrane protease YdiL (CAAX protease family)